MTAHTGLIGECIENATDGNIMLDFNMLLACLFQRKDTSQQALPEHKSLPATQPSFTPA